MPSPTSACWALTISPFPKELETTLCAQYNKQKSIKWWSGVVEDNGDSGIIHCHLALAYKTRVTREAVMKTLWKECLKTEMCTLGKITKKGIKLKPWYNDNWIDSYPQGREIGHPVASLPKDLDYLPKDDDSFKRPETNRTNTPSLHDKILAFWLRDMGDSQPLDREDVNNYLRYLQFQTLEIGVIDRYKYNGRVEEMFQFIKYNNAPSLLDALKTRLHHPRGKKATPTVKTTVTTVEPTTKVAGWEVTYNQDSVTSSPDNNKKNSGVGWPISCKCPDPDGCVWCIEDSAQKGSHDIYENTCKYCRNEFGNMSGTTSGTTSGTGGEHLGHESGTTSGTTSGTGVGTCAYDTVSVFRATARVFNKHD